MLTTKQEAVLRAVIERIVPADDFPGGWEAGAGDYLQNQWERDLATFLPLYRGGLDALDAEAQASANTDFAQMEHPAQDALLARVEKGRVATAWLVDPVVFFRNLVEHTMEGFYSDPGNNGNRNTVSWKMIGFEVRG